MSRYPTVSAFDHAATEEATLAEWREHDVFAQSLAIRDGAPHFVFYEGPPTANGKPGIHHVMSRTIKDLFCRYKTMKGFRVDRKAGWDTHGLPVEIEVEKELGLAGRHEVEDYGVEAYNAACRESVLRYKGLWDSLTERMGYWVDMSAPYVTFENEYIETVWWLLKQIHERQTADGEPLLYQGYKIQWYSPGNGTVLSSHEVSLGYKETQDPSVYVRFPVEGEPDTYFLAWTTTPWTLPSNAALAVGESIDYVKIEKQNEAGETEYIYVAEALLGVIAEEFEVVERLTGRDLVGKNYTPVFDTFVNQVAKGKAWRVVPADFVSTADGTGIVHIAPSFGVDDSLLGQREALPLLNAVHPDGTFTDDVPLVAGQWFKDADKALARDLRERGLLYRHETYLHNYPHDWRKGTPLMQYPVESWFIRTTAIKDRLIDLNKTINWQPEGIGEGRFGQWLEGNVDWAISRMRYWGTPIPIWVNDQNPKDFVVIGSLEELRDKAGIGKKVELDLHRPFVDEITWDAPNGGTYRRVPDLLDVWFDSGAMPFAQWHYPFENEDKFEQNFPADFIAEGVDQTRGWFYTLHAIAALLRDSVAYKNVVVNGLVLDEQGQKMSKSVGNTVDPFEAIRQHGVDPLRWTMMAASAPWENVRYSDRAVEETKRKFFSTITNTYSFFATYANLDGYVYDDALATAIEERPELDRWILSRLNTTVGEVDAAYAAYHPTQAARAQETFVDDLSNWYLRRSRRRFWKSESDLDKRSAYDTVWTCLTTLAKTMAPLAPFYADWLWSRVRTEDAPASVHLADFPTVNASAVDADLELRMGLARQVASLTLALRNEAGINVRQPLGTLSVVTGTAGVDEAMLRSVEGIILDEVNVKAIGTIGSGSTLVAKSAKPNFKLLGKRLGPKMKAANAAIRSLDTTAITQYEQDGHLTLDLDPGSESGAGSEPFVFGPGELEITSEGVEGQQVGQEGSVTVALDTTLTDALRGEGLAREFVNRVQNLRKTAGFEVSDRIDVTFEAPHAVAEAVRVHSGSIRNETLAESLSESAAPSGEAVETFDIGGETVQIGVRRLPSPVEA